MTFVREIKRTESKCRQKDREKILNVTPRPILPSRETGTEKRKIEFFLPWIDLMRRTREVWAYGSMRSRAWSAGGTKGNCTWHKCNYVMSCFYHNVAHKESASKIPQKRFILVALPIPPLSGRAGPAYRKYQNTGYKHLFFMGFIASKIIYF